MIAACNDSPASPILPDRICAIAREEGQSAFSGSDRAARRKSSVASSSRPFCAASIACWPREEASCRRSRLTLSRKLIILCFELETPHHGEVNVRRQRSYAQGVLAEPSPGTAYRVAGALHRSLGGWSSRGADSGPAQGNAGGR